MSTQIKIIPARDFIEVTTDGTINLVTSRQLITDIADSEHHQATHELLVDFRETECTLSVVDVYQLASELCRHGNTFRKKIALLVLPGFNFDRARFFETCSFNRGFSINAYTDYETALRWILEA
ncbi:MAG: hypothetical protein PHI31_11360 [Desulfuromonadaceae bacterium]|nr:hypothetical protein [Desulfuromonadaceae bacterium]